ncbi:RagB/SusD family nutrient uptake outer membrane protein [Lutibacter sp.]|uniref:RagB/SusD family nutrient uptake outer membrane protein n=1 Tax=Lutibacter sp. TaxID=1925666 RepID=UPI0027350160|nr:RagB/SusD family nutrient uptake outer membrane protein [Lutibacter sp.]MDP3314105.1 RagB/SusD family nutrient uptake outer membrane protein [Lutibacter sp.]
MNYINNFIKLMLLAVAFLVTGACNDNLDELAENRSFTGDTDYTISSNMINPLIGAYAEFNGRGWEDFPLISVRGDDVNAGGLGDQQDYAETDKYNYNKDYWMYNSVWQNLYFDILVMHSTIEQIELYKANGGNPVLAEQYIAEAKVLRGFLLLQVSRVWGNVFITKGSDPSDLLIAPVSSKAEVMQHISNQMDEAIPVLLDVRPNQRTDIRGGATKYTALAIKALVNLELKKYDVVASATAQIISSSKFSLATDFYELFKLDGKLNNENLLELQFSDFGQGSGNNRGHLFAFYGPENWTPSVTGSGSGWGFYEPSLKYIKFMLSRGEQVRLETSVLFTNRGINAIKADPAYATLPSWITNTTRDGDRINDYARAMFASGKHYLPSNQLTTGRTDYGTNKNFTCIRYAEILLMHAEALTQGASSTGLTAAQAVNLVRTRAGLSSLSAVTNAQVMDEKFAELAMEWGTRYYDNIRLGNIAALTYDGRTFSENKTFLPYPQAQVDKLPILRGQ